MIFAILKMMFNMEKICRGNMMISEKKVKLMTQMALYESKEGHEDLQICEYDRKDYVSFHTIISLLWVTLGYMLVAVLLAFNYIEVLIAKMSKALLIGLLGVGISGYIVFLVLFGLIAVFIYGGKYDRARRRVKRYGRNLTRLRKIQDRENL